MADDSFRSYRSRDAFTPEHNPVAPEGADDPLAELARLIGQSDAYAEPGGQQAYNYEPVSDAEQSGLDWAAEARYADEHEGQDRYAAPPPPPTYEPQARGFEDETPAGGQFFSGAAAKFNGFGDEPDLHDREDRRSAGAGRQVPAFTSATSDGRYGTDGSDHHGAEAYAEDYYDEVPRSGRRGGAVVIMAVIGLVVVGAAGAFAYRAMFGGSIMSGLPPIIKASNAPNKIVPSHGESQANSAAQSGRAATEKMVSREEQPVNVEPPKPAPRVVSTIPVAAGPSESAPTEAPPPLATASAPNPAASAAPLTGGAQPVQTPTAAAPATPAPPASSEPKKVHTVTIHTNHGGGSGALPPPPAAAPRSVARQPAPKPSASESAARRSANAPMSIMPGAEGEPVALPPANARASAPPLTVASAGPVTGLSAKPPSGGGYAVQVSSQHSEADAKASFRELRAKYPQQLGGREPIIRRADLGAKGVYYRAMVGPFASIEAAASMCSSLKAAGGNCLVQRN